VPKQRDVEKLRIHSLLEEAEEALSKEDHAVAENRFAQVAESFEVLGNGQTAAIYWGKAAALRLVLHLPFEAVVACEKGLLANNSHWECASLSASALECLGLLDNAEDRLERCSRACPKNEYTVFESLNRVRERKREIEKCSSVTLMDEIGRFTAFIGEREAAYWVSSVGQRSLSKDGRKELVQTGFLRKEWLDLPNNADVARRATYVALKYRLSKKLIKILSVAGITRGVCDKCVLPKALRDPAAPEAMTEAACGRLARDRLAVIDGVFTEDVMRRMKAELQALRKKGILQNDSNDVCNPEQRAFYLPFMDGRADYEGCCPATFEVLRRVCGLPFVLEENLGLRLAVPQSAMVACSPPKASYKKHLDNYSIVSNHEDVPRKVTILLYCNVDWKPGLGGSLRTWPAFDADNGTPKEIYPVAGRIVAFMAEEIWHEVLEAKEDRYALTLWCHDRDQAVMVK
jgi:hypothetical protein